MRRLITSLLVRIYTVCYSRVCCFCCCCCWLRLKSLLAAMDICILNDGRVHFRNSRMKGLNVVLFSDLPKLSDITKLVNFCFGLSLYFLVYNNNNNNINNNNNNYYYYYYFYYCCLFILCFNIGTLKCQNRAVKPQHKQNVKTCFLGKIRHIFHYVVY